MTINLLVIGLLSLLVVILLLLYVNERRSRKKLSKELNILDASHDDAQKRLAKVIKISDNQQLELFKEKDNVTKNNARLRIILRQSDRFQAQLRDAKEEAVAAEKAKDSFLSNMSHEIRTPLNAILGFIQILQRSKLSTKDMGHLGIIETSSHSLLAIINDILDFAKIRSGKFTIDPHEVDITKEMADICELYSSKIFEKNIDFLTHINPTVPKLIEVDAVRIKQVVSNYLSNAVKFTPKNGNIGVNVSFDEAKNYLNIYVKDDGIGIRQDNQAKVFDVFSQEDSSTSRRFGGTGLGLSICKQLTELMGGRTGLESEEGNGSTFSLHIPAKIKNDALRLYETSENIAIFLDNTLDRQKKLLVRYLDEMDIEYTIIDTYTTEHTFSKLITTLENIKKFNITQKKGLDIVTLEYGHKEDDYEYHELTLPLNAFKIEEALNKKAEEIVQEQRVKQFSGHVLVAEDNVVNQQYIALLLEDYGLSFDIAKDGQETVDFYKQKDYDLILMDCQMPKKSGIEATVEILEYEKDQNKKALPIVALSANALPEDKEKFIAVGIDDYITKPIDLKELEKVLGKHLPSSTAN